MTDILTTKFPLFQLGSGWKTIIEALEYREGAVWNDDMGSRMRDQLLSEIDVVLKSLKEQLAKMGVKEL